MSLPAPEKIPVEGLDRFEWLALEALWGTAKSPYETQWERWQSQESVSDPATTTGLVVGGNLQRFNIFLNNADALTAEGRPANDLYSFAAEHLGKMAGGILGIATHFRTDPARWSNPLGDHITDHFNTTEGALSFASENDATTLDSEDYYELLEPVLEAIRKGGEDKKIANLQADKLLQVAGIAVRSWGNFLETHNEIEIVPGATPRSTGVFIENLRIDFEQYVPVVQAFAKSRR